MRAHRLEVNIPDDHRLSVELPADFPAGPAELIVLSEAAKERGVVRLGGVLSPQGAAPEGDPIADALEEMRADRAERLARRVEELRPPHEK